MEATVICMDNSEWTRNGDYSPTRFQAQNHAVTLLANIKVESNRENRVGVLTMAGDMPKLLVTPTNNDHKILRSVTQVDIDGMINLGASIQIAQLALKHRQSKNHKQRIILFLGSPIQERWETMVKIGKNLKKNNVAVDIVSFGNDTENNETLEKFLDSVNSNNNSHIVKVPVGVAITDACLGSPLVIGDDAMGGFEGGVPQEGNAQGFGQYVNPSIDPELALALKVSMEEEKARQKALEGQQDGAGEKKDGESKGATNTDGGQGSSAIDNMEIDDDQLLQKAINLSMQNEEVEEKRKIISEIKAHPVDISEIDQDEKDDNSKNTVEKLQNQKDNEDEDENLYKDILSDLPGVDPNTPEMKGLLEQMKRNRNKKDDKK